MHKYTFTLIGIALLMTAIIVEVITMNKQPITDNPKHIDLPEEWRAINDTTLLKGRVSGDTLYIEFKN